MPESPANPGQPRRLWLLVVVLALAAAGAWYSWQRRSLMIAEHVAIGGGRAQLLEFGMGICEQCKRMRPVMERARRELGATLDAHILDIRQEENERLAERFKMVSMPLVVLVDGAGQELWRHEGFVDFPELSREVRKRIVTGRSCTEPEEICAP